MKALSSKSMGRLILSIHELPVPDLKPGEALIELHASAINPGDVKNVAGFFKASLAKEHSMRSYLASLLLGAAVGVVYGLVRVRSPAPPAIALLGLLGMLAGEQAVSLVRSHVFKTELQLGASRLVK
jgi:XapX domain-containing protein